MSTELLYVRAGLSNTGLKNYKDFSEVLYSQFGATEIFAPNFKPPRRRYSPKVLNQEQYVMNMLSRLIISHTESFVTNHPHYSFVGVGDKLNYLSNTFKSDLPFGFLNHILDKEDFSMLLWGCLDESPGFSTIHVAQEMLGLTKKHFLRFAYLWDYNEYSITAQTMPGCSARFGNMYPKYKLQNNFIKGTLLNKSYIYIPSARSALDCDIEQLLKQPHFVSCGRLSCISCMTKFY